MRPKSPLNLPARRRRRRHLLRRRLEASLLLVVVSSVLVVVLLSTLPKASSFLSTSSSSAAAPPPAASFLVGPSASLASSAAAGEAHRRRRRRRDVGGPGTMSLEVGARAGGGRTSDDDSSADASVLGVVVVARGGPSLNWRDAAENSLQSRRRALLSGMLSAPLLASGCAAAPAPARAADDDERGDDLRGFRSGAYGREEYTNSIVASRDTNISPREVYDSIASQYVRHPLTELQRGGGGPADDKEGGRRRPARALDVGAGAGVSTQVLWELGYRRIDAVDWSGSAWERFVVDDPDGYVPTEGGLDAVKFYEMDDESYLDLWREQGREKFDVIVFNFAVNESKARYFASELLRPENGRLLAPVNAQRDYWLKQTYKAFDAKGNVLWSAGDVGAWSVQFQPDVTQDTCQGVWCAPFNGFQKKKR